jgi:hypothetical protein
MVHLLPYQSPTIKRVLSSCLVPSFLATCICHAVGMRSRSITQLSCMYLVMARSKRGRDDGISR